MDLYLIISDGLLRVRFIINEMIEFEIVDFLFLDADVPLLTYSIVYISHQIVLLECEVMLITLMPVEDC